MILVILYVTTFKTGGIVFICRCLMSHRHIIFSTRVSPLIWTISLREIKGEMYIAKVPLTLMTIINRNYEIKTKNKITTNNIIITYLKCTEYVHILSIQFMLALIDKMINKRVFSTDNSVLNKKKPLCY